ncbi:MAG: hypothetical protein HW403_974 [Dehalococcoidia bacterium]|nr:hypothetical protein [Dehalococcoidia bacterium]
MKRITVVLDDEEMYAAIKEEASRLNRSVKDVVREALERWLEAQEDAEDMADYDERMAEYREKGGIPWEEANRRIQKILNEREQSPADSSST